MPKNENVIERGAASLRLLEAAYKSFGNGLDDLATMALLGCVMFAAYEEFELKNVELAEDEFSDPSLNYRSKAVTARWFNFLKHGTRGKRNPGGTFDFSDILTSEDRDENIFGLIFQATALHITAYEKRSSTVNMIMVTGIAIYGHSDESEGLDESASDQLKANLRYLAKHWIDLGDRSKIKALVEADENLEMTFGQGIGEYYRTVAARTRKQ